MQSDANQAGLCLGVAWFVFSACVANGHFAISGSMPRFGRLLTLGPSVDVANQEGHASRAIRSCAMIKDTIVLEAAVVARPWNVGEARISTSG